jgi:hypothetical protein
MPTQDWLRKEFNYGYSSGDILSDPPDPILAVEEARIGGSYREVFGKALAPHVKPDSRVLELGPGRGSWTRPLLSILPRGELHTADFQDVTPWLHPEKYGGRLICHRISDNDFSEFPDDYFDIFWSFGVLCHNNVEQIELILRNIRPRLKDGAWCVHHYADWEKLDRFGWEKGTVSTEFQSRPDDEIWWPRNDAKTMAGIIKKAGYRLETADCGIVARDSIAIFQKI